MPWEISSERSVYLQLIDIIKQKIMSGEYQPGQRLPSVRELATDAAVNPNTMQRALNELEREGLLVSERTAGRFVTTDRNLIAQLKKEAAEEAADAFRREMLALGFSEEEMIAFFRRRCESVGFDLERIG